MPSSCRSRTARAAPGSTLRRTHTKARLRWSCASSSLRAAASSPSARAEGGGGARGVCDLLGHGVDALRVHGHGELLAVAVEDGAAPRVEVDGALALARGLALEGLRARNLELDEANAR